MQKVVVDISNEYSNSRIDKIIYERLSADDANITRSHIQNLIRDGYLKKNGIVFNDTSYRTKIGDSFEITIPNKAEQKIEANDIELNIVYEDDDLAVINKQAGLTTHPGIGNSEYTLVNALLHRYGENGLSNIGGDFRQGIVHRLDKDTSGLMVIAKNNKAHENLAQQLQDRQLKRNYIGFLWGSLTPNSGTIEGYMQRSKKNIAKMEMVKDENARYSKTNYRTIKKYLGGLISAVDFNLDTGRTHQIRVHCSHLGHPLVGDELYGAKSRHLPKEYESIVNLVEKFPRQALHSYRISFHQPTSGELREFEVGLPEDMEELRKEIEKVE